MPPLDEILWMLFGALVTLAGYAAVVAWLIADVRAAAAEWRGGGGPTGREPQCRD